MQNQSEYYKDTQKDEISIEKVMKLYKHLYKRSDDDRKQNNEKINFLEKEIIEGKKKNELLEKEIIEIRKKTDEKINSLKIEIKYVKEILGNIQARDQINNLFNSFKTLLTEDEVNQIKENKKLKGKIYLQAIKRKYNNYIKTEKFQIFEEIIKRAGETLNKGNPAAHSLNLDIYKEKIEAYKKQYNLYVANVEKLAFLINIKMPENLFYKAFKYIDEHFLNNMSTKIFRIGEFEKGFV